MAKRTPFGMERLIKELNSKSFLDGLEKIVRYTQDTGREAGFNIYYSEKEDVLVFPRGIVIGNESYVNLDPKRLKFEQPPRERDIPVSIADTIAKELAEVSPRLLSFPESEDYNNRHEKGFPTMERTPLISVHTHPYFIDAIEDPKDLIFLHFGIIAADPENPIFLLELSAEDLRSLNENRRAFVNSGDVNTYNARNPLSITVQIYNSSADRFRMIIAQENSEEPLPGNTCFEKIACMYNITNLARIASMIDEEIYQDVKQMIRKINGLEDFDSYFNNIKYNFLSCVYIIDGPSKKVEVTRGTSIRPLVQ